MTIRIKSIKHFTTAASSIEDEDSFSNVCSLKSTNIGQVTNKQSTVSVFLKLKNQKNYAFLQVTQLNYFFFNSLYQLKE